MIFHPLSDEIRVAILLLYISAQWQTFPEIWCLERKKRFLQLRKWAFQQQFTILRGDRKGGKDFLGGCYPNQTNSIVLKEAREPSLNVKL